MPTSTHILQSAQAIAQTLANRETDVNELAKVATYARAHLDGAYTFRLLETMTKDRDSRYVVRTGQTLTYYQDIAEACQQHLSAYRQAKAAKAHELAEILGWAVRLMRYYDTVGTPAPGPSLPLSGVPTPPANRSVPSNLKQSVPSKQHAITKEWELVTLVEDTRRARAQVETRTGERIMCTSLPTYQPLKQGMGCRAEVIRHDGKAQSATFKRLE